MFRSVLLGLMNYLTYGGVATSFQFPLYVRRRRSRVTTNQRNANTPRQKTAQVEQDKIRTKLYLEDLELLSFGQDVLRNKNRTMSFWIYLKSNFPLKKKESEKIVNHHELSDSYISITITQIHCLSAEKCGRCPSANMEGEGLMSFTANRTGLKCFPSSHW